MNAHSPRRTICEYWVAVMGTGTRWVWGPFKEAVNRGGTQPKTCMLLARFSNIGVLDA